ncbi:MAG: 3-oxoacyl-ACP reductase FabG [Burkholderiales bacterium]|nr:3-oxoacyl-ACP reductase FabG [Burkholderiales bacterium]
MSEIRKIALVTGATRGIGRAVALSLAKAGNIVIGTATSQAGADTINEYLKEFGGHGIVLNVANKETIEQVVADIAAKYGDITILVNNAGITKDGLFLRMKEEDWDIVMDTNLKSVFLLSKAVIRGMTKARFGRIVNISSVAGFMGNPGQVNYASSKAAVVAFAKSLAKELGSRNITVNCVAPGFIQTDMTECLAEDAKSVYLAQIPLNRFGDVEDIANSVQFLVGDTGKYITGSTIHVNGGLYM